jgi:hypothetical protein
VNRLALTLLVGLVSLGCLAQPCEWTERAMVLPEAQPSELGTCWAIMTLLDGALSDPNSCPWPNDEQSCTVVQAGEYPRRWSYYARAGGPMSPHVIRGVPCDLKSCDALLLWDLGGRPVDGQPASEELRP